MTTPDNADPLMPIIEAAWLEAVNGSWSKSDFKIFTMGYRKGYAQKRGSCMRVAQHRRS